MEAYRGVLFLKILKSFGPSRGGPSGYSGRSCGVPFVVEVQGAAVGCLRTVSFLTFGWS